jgi:hypothetical protein
MDEQKKTQSRQEFLFRALEQERKVVKAEQLRDEAEEWHIKALEIELAGARAYRERRMATRANLPIPETSFTAVNLQTSKARQDIHRLFEEADKIYEEEDGKLGDFYGEPSEAGYAELKAEVRALGATSEAPEEEGSLGMLGEMLKDARAVIERALDRFVNNPKTLEREEAEFWEAGLSSEGIHDQTE